ncbi:hypothetical protein HYZ06_02170 [Candidatus Daviesbacteria bacterium]|nr:hypothetical protein [Candidatus Daviesbacteria bacterium]
MEYEQLTTAEVGVLNTLVDGGQLTRHHFPFGSIGLDSMGPMRDSSTDALFPGAAEALHSFSDTLRRYNLTLIVATNGPDKEGEDILGALSRTVFAFAITEGGGKMLTLDQGPVILANEGELENLRRLEEEAKKYPFLKTLLEDTDSRDGAPPMRTPYTTNIVLTLPTTYEVLQRRLYEGGVMEEDIPGIGPANYVAETLGFAAQHFKGIIAQLGLHDQATVIVKGQNRRVYVTPMHIHDGDLIKHDAAQFASRVLAHDIFGSYLSPYALEHLVYRLENSIYVADQAVGTTDEGQRIISASERSMILGFDYFSTQPDEGANILSRHLLENERPLPFMGDVAARLAINVTLDDSLPRMEFVERVPILHIGSGIKALEALAYLYRRFHN